MCAPYLEAFLLSEVLEHLGTQLQNRAYPLRMRNEGLNRWISSHAAASEADGVATSTQKLSENGGTGFM